MVLLFSPGGFTLPLRTVPCMDGAGDGELHGLRAAEMGDGRQGHVMPSVRAHVSGV